MATVEPLCSWVSVTTTGLRLFFNSSLMASKNGAYLHESAEVNRVNHIYKYRAVILSSSSAPSPAGTSAVSCRALSKPSLRRRTQPTTGHTSLRGCWSWRIGGGRAPGDATMS